MTDENKTTTQVDTRPTQHINPQGEEFLLQFFAFAHLPEKLQAASEPFSQLAHFICSRVPRNPERTVALRKLLEAKDCAVRAVIAK